MAKLPSLNTLTAHYTDANGSAAGSIGSSRKIKNYGRLHRSTGTIETKFDDIEEFLENLILEAEVVVGAVAWLTNPILLEAIAKCSRTALVVQKEDFLRNDSESEADNFRKRVKLQYSRLKPITSDDFLNSYPGCQDGVVGMHDRIAEHLVSYHGLHVSGSVRAIGYDKSKNLNITPLMHHKFAVLGHYRPDHLIDPFCVVTGSFNWTTNARSSRENIVVIHDPNICADFISEWAQLWARSEELNWNSEIPEPQIHFIGT